MFAAFAAYSTVKVLFIWNGKNSGKNKQKNNTQEKNLLDMFLFMNLKAPPSRTKYFVDSMQVRLDACTTDFPAALISDFDQNFLHKISF